MHTTEQLPSMKVEGKEGKEEEMYPLTREGCMHRRERYKIKAKRDHWGVGGWEGNGGLSFILKDEWKTETCLSPSKESEPQGQVGRMEVMREETKADKYKGRNELGGGKATPTWDH